jgi:hypothetical protein
VRNPVRWARTLARYLRATGNRLLRWAGARLALLQDAWSTRAGSTDADPAQAGAGAETAASAPAPRKTADILAFEPRGEDFALVRLKADGSRSEIVLTTANVVHLGLLAPGFSRQVLTDKLGKQPGVVAAVVRSGAMNANLRFIEVLLTILDRGGARLDFSTTERRARALASKLMERADRIANTPTKPAKDPR